VLSAAEHYCCSWCPQFIADGVFFAELNELLTRELAEDGYSGVEVRVTPMRTEIIIRATRTQNVLGEQQAAAGHRMSESRRLKKQKAECSKSYAGNIVDAAGANPTRLVRTRCFSYVVLQQTQQRLSLLSVYRYTLQLSNCICSTKTSAQGALSHCPAPSHMSNFVMPARTCPPPPLLLQVRRAAAFAS
jgi:hypothetical protein